MEYFLYEEYQQREKGEEVEDRRPHPATFLKKQLLIHFRYQASQRFDASISNADCDDVEYCESLAVQEDHSGQILDGVAGQY